MLEYYVPYSMFILVLIAAIVATIKWDKYKNSTERYFVYFLWSICFFECLAAFSNYYLGTNFWVYNIYSIYSFLFYLNWYHSILKNKIIKYVMVFFLLVVIVNILTEDFIDDHQIYTFIAGAISVLISTFLYYSEVLKSNEIFIIKQKLSFWIATGILLFHIGMIPLIVMADVLDFAGGYYLAVLFTLNFILYGCYIIGFLWTKKIFNRL